MNQFNYLYINGVDSSGRAGEICQPNVGNEHLSARRYQWLHGSTERAGGVLDLPAWRKDRRKLKIPPGLDGAAPVALCNYQQCNQRIC